MKHRNLFFVTAVIAVASISSCKTKGAKDIIVNKWHMTDVSGKAADLMPDSLKTKMYKEAAIEFKKDGKFATEGMGPNPKMGTYQISADEKTLITIEDGLKYADTIKIVELTAAKMILQDTRGDVKLSFKSH